jgi:hypothetical protein
MPEFKHPKDKMERTSATAAAVTEAERLAREKKTAKLRALRLAKEVTEKSRPLRGRPGSR